MYTILFLHYASVKVGKIHKNKEPEVWATTSPSCPLEKEAEKPTVSLAISWGLRNKDWILEPGLKGLRPRWKWRQASDLQHLAVFSRLLFTFYQQLKTLNRKVNV